MYCTCDYRIYRALHSYFLPYVLQSTALGTRTSKVSSIRSLPLTLNSLVAFHHLIFKRRSQHNHRREATTLVSTSTSLLYPLPPSYPSLSYSTLLSPLQAL